MALVKLAGTTNENNFHTALESKIRHVYDLCQISQHSHYRMLFNSSLLLELIQKVKNNDQQNISGDKGWLKYPLSDMAFFANPAYYWHSVEKNFLGNFSQLVHSDELPSQASFIHTFSQIHQLLSKIK